MNNTTLVNYKQFVNVATLAVEAAKNVHKLFTKYLLTN